MFIGINAGGKIIKGEEVEQIVNEIIKILAQHKLNYDSSIYILDETKNKLGEKSFIKD